MSGHISRLIAYDSDSLDPPRLKTSDKLRKLIDAMIKERGYILEEMQGILEHSAEMAISTIRQIGWSKENGRDPIWGSYGPAQGIGIDKISSMAGRLYEIDSILDGIYKLWPKLKPEIPEE